MAEFLRRDGLLGRFRWQQHHYAQRHPIPRERRHDVTTPGSPVPYIARETTNTLTPARAASTLPPPESAGRSFVDTLLFGLSAAAAFFLAYQALLRQIELRAAEASWSPVVAAAEAPVQEVQPPVSAPPAPASTSTPPAPATTPSDDAAEAVAVSIDELPLAAGTTSRRPTDASRGRGEASQENPYAATKAAKATSKKSRRGKKQAAHAVRAAEAVGWESTETAKGLVETPRAEERAAAAAPAASPPANPGGNVFFGGALK